MRHLGKIIDIIKNEEGFKVPKYGRDAPDDTKPFTWQELDQHFKDGNDISEQEYIDILSDEYPNLGTSWLDSYASITNSSEKRVGDIINQSKHNNHSTNQKVLDKLSESGDDEDDVFTHLAERGNINGKTIDDFVGGKYISPMDRDYNNILKNPKLTPQHLEKFVQMRPQEIATAIDHPKFDEGSLERLINGGKLQGSIDGHFADTLIRKRMGGYDLNGNPRPNKEKTLDLNPRVVRSLLEDYHEEIRNHSLNVLLDHTEPTFKKQWTDEKLGITGGSYGHTEPGEEGFQEDNWANWASGDNMDSSVAKFLAGSRHIDDKQAEHIKRHANIDDKYALYNNKNVDPRHGVEMFQKWHDDEDNHGYDAEELQEQFKHYKDDVYTIDDLDESEIDDIRENIWNNGDVYEDAEQAYSIQDWVNDHGDEYLENNPESGGDTTIDETYEALHENHDWEGENPNASQNVGNPEYDALNSLYEKFSLENNMVGNEDFKDAGIDPSTINLKPDEEGDYDGDQLLERLSDFGGPLNIDFANNDYDLSINEHPDFEDRFNEAHKQTRKDKLEYSPWEFDENIYEDYRESEGYMNAEQEVVEDRVKEDAKEHLDELYDTSHQDTRFIPDHLHPHIPNFETLQNEQKTRISDGGNRKFLNKYIKNRDYEHHYGDDQHYYEMVKDHAEANNGKIDIGTMNKLYPAQKEKWKKVFGGKGKLTHEEAAQKLDELPKTKYDISYGKWGGGKMQNINKQDQIIFRLDHSNESLRPLMEDPALYETFKKVQSVSKQSGHPTKDNTIAWARVDTSDPKHWMIDEVQSDFGKTVTKYLKNEGADEKAAHVEKISAHHKNWRESLTNAVLKEAKKHGAQQVSTHSPESKSKHTSSSKIHSVYKDSYKKVPRSMGFKAAKMEDLPLSDSGKGIFQNKNQDKEDAIFNHINAHKYHLEMARANEHLEQTNNPEINSRYVSYKNDHSNLANQHLERIKGIKPNHHYVKLAEHSAANGFGDILGNDGFKNSDAVRNAREAAIDGNFANHENDRSLSEPIKEFKDNNLGGHTFNLKPSLLKKHIDDCLEYLEKLEKGEGLNAVKGGILALGLGLGAHSMTQNANKQATEQFAQQNAPKHARNASSLKTEVDPVQVGYEKAQKEAGDIIYKNNKKWFLGNHSNGLSPHVYKQTIKNNPELSQKYGYTNKLSNGTFKEIIEKNPHLREDVHSAHYDKLHQAFGGDHEQMLYAWSNGIKATNKKFSREPANVPKIGENPSPDIVDKTVKNAPKTP